ncbi:unnamed protein product [Lathyrus oleraceus]|uniref:Syntaxin 6/10/61 N-terminal domain-containing protein n=1 Tax=Pisum sativum TaxID=3888 RepID=A0A9D4W1B4_PEA|nr:uncharacterized protein LOC127092326 isoform X2 [Pisum sativum]KAI5393242.1 hypothetical protein KIW84_060385 [Pisum sativum]
MATSFDRWEKDPFFNAAEEVQESADRMESTFRTWVHATKDTSSIWNPNELRRDLLTTLGTAKWQLEEFQRETKSSYSRNSGNDARTRHRDFITAMEAKIKKVELSLNEAFPLGGKASRPWVCLDEGEKDELAMFLSGMPAAESNNQRLCDKDSVVNFSKDFHVSSGRGEPKEDVSHGFRRVASASADIGYWKISVNDDPHQLSSSSGSSGGPMHKVPSLSGFFTSVESISKLKWPKNGYRKLKTVDHHKETDSALIPMNELNRGSNICLEKTKSNLDSSNECYDKHLYGWCGAIQRQLQRSQYQMQYSRLAQITVSIVFLLCLIVLITFHKM